MFQSRVALAIVFASVLLNCKSKQPEPQPQAKPVEPTGATVSASAAPTPATSYSAGDPRGAKDPFSQMNIGERLSQEKGHRPAIDPNVETFFNKLKKQNITFLEETQVAGWPVGAKYCGRGALQNDVYIVVCEYPDAESAKKGSEISAGISKTVERREVLVRKELTLAVQQAGTAPGAVAEAKKVKETFKSL